MIYFENILCLPSVILFIESGCEIKQKSFLRNMSTQKKSYLLQQIALQFSYRKTYFSFFAPM